MIIYTMGFTKKSAEIFFEKLKKANIQLLIDVRLNNKSQLAGFTKGSDLSYFLKEIVHCEYKHCDEYAPTKEILDDYKKGGEDWNLYVERFLPLMKSRLGIKNFMKKFGGYEKVCLLCSEPTPERCHRRLVAELIKEEFPEVEIRHI